MRADLGFGSSGMVFTTARQLVGGDAATRTDIPAWVHSDDEPRYESILGTPVIVDGRVVATLLLHHAEPNHFDSDDTVLMQTVAEQISAAVRRARLRDESEHRAQRMGIALEVATAVAAARTAEETIGAAVATIHRMIGGEAIAGLVAELGTGGQGVVAE